ncbi:MAG: N-6 DNA methylase [Bacteroidota bacterium]
MTKTEAEELKDGYIFDYISNEQVKATPEEIEAVQVFCKQLVEDYGYSKDQIQTRPQYRVKANPSDTTKSYPLDIIVFSNNKKIDTNEYIIIECKKKTRNDGITQLQDYLKFSNAYIGVWFNGSERIFLKKYETKGKVHFEEIPNIPIQGQRLEDIGKFKRKDLKPTHNLKVIFNSIRNHLAGNATGTGRDEIIAQQLINLIFCKIYDERFTKKDDDVSFRVGIEEEGKVVKNRIIEIFEKVKTKYSEVIEVADEIKLDADSIKYVVGELQNFCLIESERDIIADAFETFIGYSLKGAQGQFFTPRNVIKLMVEIINPQPNELLIDPACGTGGFLVESLRHIWKVLDKQALDYGWSDLALNEEKLSSAIKCIKGLEKDDFLSKVAKAYMAILGDGKGGIFCEDSLKLPAEWKPTTRQQIDLDKFDVLLANPPFGKDIKVKGEEKLKQFDLAYNWKKEINSYSKTNKIKKEETIQILFIERSLKLLKDGGRMGIVLPETFFHAPKSRYVLHYMLRNNNVTWMLDLPHNTFRPHNNAKCVVIVLEKNRPQQDEINMAVAEEIGHDHQGKEIFRWDYIKKEANKTQLWDDIPLIIEELESNKFTKYCFKVKSKSAITKNIFVPRYYWQNKLKEIESIAKAQSLELVPIKELMRKGIITSFDGHGSPPAEYKGKGEVPYVRVKDNVNWEVYKDPTAKITTEIYLEKKGKNKNLEAGDVVYVRRGSYRIGSVAMVSPFDKEALYTREILILRVTEEENEYGLNPYYLLYLLSHKLTHLQAKNKILIETTLPNIAERWKELMLPIDTDKKQREFITNKIKEVITSKWEAIEKIDNLKNELGDLVT